MTEQKPLQRYWLVPATGFANAHMEPADDGEWVRYDAARAATPAAPEARTFGDLTDDEVRDAVLTERLDWEAEQVAATPAAPEDER